MRIEMELDLKFKERYLEVNDTVEHSPKAIITIYEVAENIILDRNFINNLFVTTSLESSLKTDLHLVALMFKDRLQKAIEEKVFQSTISNHLSLNITEENQLKVYLHCDDQNFKTVEDIFKVFDNEKIMFY